jgi:hypothetical protein
MKEDLLAVAIVLAMTFLLLWLRHIILNLRVEQGRKFAQRSQKTASSQLEEFLDSHSMGDQHKYVSFQAGVILSSALLLALHSHAAAQVEAELAARPVQSSDALKSSELLEQVRYTIERLEKRLSKLEAENESLRLLIQSLSSECGANLSHNIVSIEQNEVCKICDSRPQTTQSVSNLKSSSSSSFFDDMTINFMLDGYYSYNFNRPVGRINLLRAYDVLSNSFSLNQAALVIESAPNLKAGRRFGMRLDLQYGQATETLQGSPTNELRPQVYRHIFQAYGTYVAPLGNGLTLDFGKFASPLGIENNYTKDQINYSRSYYYNFLPFYHFGLRARYPINDKLAIAYQLVNGTQQSEDFNGFKSQHFALILIPSKRLNWQINYYVGREQRDFASRSGQRVQNLPTQPGLSIEVIRPAPRGRLHILDSYLTWKATSRMTLAVEADYVINRVQEFSPPSRIAGGATYARYQITPRFALAGRAEYLSDHSGLFSGMTQVLKEITLTADYLLADGFLIRNEWRRDFSNRRFFLTDEPNIFKKQQNTLTIGLIWWLGRKEGSW